MTLYGIVIRIETERRFGVIWRADSQSQLPFLFSDFLAPEDELEAPLPVTFVERPHRQDHKRVVASSVRPLRDAPAREGVITYLENDWGFIRLSDGEDAFFHTSCTREENLRRGQPVVCTVVPGLGDRFFTLSLNRAADVPDDTRKLKPADPVIACGAASRRGQRTTKSVNDDAFLVQPLPHGAWLLAVADGVSNPPHGWWASDKCTELLWRSARDFARRLAEDAHRDQQKSIMGDWLRLVHENFLEDRRRQSHSEYASATTTLTFAVVSPQRLLYANSGDTPLYVYSVRRRTLTSVIDVWARSRAGPRGQTHLTQHMASSRRVWDPQVGATDIAPGDLVVICSDGVASGEKSLDKHNLLKNLLGEERLSLQERVDSIVTKIAALGEPDDLTLLAFRFQESP